MLHSKWNQITKNSKGTKKKFFSRGYEQVADLLKEGSYSQELFEAGGKPIASLQATQGYGACTIYFTDVIQIFYKESNEKFDQEPISTCIKHRHYMILDIIEKDLTVSLIFDLYFHVTNSGEIINVSHNSEKVSDAISALESEFCSHIYNRHNDHRDEGTNWYNYVDINSIYIHNK